MPKSDLNIRLDLLESVSNPRGIRLGVSSNYGSHTKELILGIFLAIEDSDINVCLLWSNDMRNKTGALTAAKYFIDQNVFAVIGHLSATTALVASKIYNRNGIPYFAPGTTHCDLISSKHSTTFRVNGRDDIQAEFIASSLSKLSNQNPVLLIQDIEYGLSLSSLICKYLSSSTKYNICYNLISSGKYRNVFQSIAKNSNRPVIICGIHEFAILCCRQLRNHHYHGSIFMGDDGYTNNFLNHGGSYVEGVWIATCEPKIELSNLQHLHYLNNRYNKLIEEEPSGYFLFSYLATVAATSGKFNKQRSKIKGNERIESKLGPIYFNERGELDSAIWSWKKVVKGTFNVESPA